MPTKDIQWERGTYLNARVWWGELSGRWVLAIVQRGEDRFELIDFARLTEQVIYPTQESARFAAELMFG